VSDDQLLNRDRQGADLKDERGFQLEIIVKYSLVLIAFVIFFWAIYHASAFLIPLSFAAILAMMLVPISKKLESWGWNRLWSSFTSVLLLIIVISGLVVLLSARASNFASQFSTIRQQVMDKYQSIRQTVQEQWHISLPTPGEFLSDESPSSPSSQGASGANQEQTSIATERDSEAAASNRPADTREPSSVMPSQINTANADEPDISASWLSSIASPIAQWLSSLLSTFGDIILALVYTFTLLYYRNKFRQFLLRVTPAEEHVTVARMINDTSGVARKYLWGRFILIFVLAVLYGVGFLVIGLQHAIFLALMASVFTFLPYIGPFIGIAFPVLVALASPNPLTPLLGVLVIYVVAQFVESYILEPVIVGAEVDINPFFTIVAVVAGGLMWGVSGMILGIPILGIARIVFDNIEPLRPYAFLLGEEKTARQPSTLTQKLKGLFQLKDDPS
jgi:predicted PurR-regulated permease PerM